MPSTAFDVASSILITLERRAVFKKGCDWAFFREFQNPSGLLQTSHVFGRDLFLKHSNPESISRFSPLTHNVRLQSSSCR